MNIKGWWIHKTVDNYNFSFSFGLPLFFLIEEKTSESIDNCIILGCYQNKAAAFLTVLRKGKEDRWGGGEERERGWMTRMPVEKDEQWHSWIFIASHICSRGLSIFSFFLDSLTLVVKHQPEKLIMYCNFTGFQGWIFVIQTDAFTFLPDQNGRWFKHTHTSHIPSIFLLIL